MNNRVFVIAEIGLAHDGSLGLAHGFIDACREAGVDAVKFQTHLACEESTAAEPFRVPFSYEDATRFDYWERTSFTPDGWKGLAEHCREAGLEFMSSPFSVAAVDLLADIGVRYWKIASGEVANEELLNRIVARGETVLLSSGLSSWAELDSSVEKVRNSGCDLMLLQATTKYPSPPETIGLNVMTEMKERYGGDVGLSDHSGTIYPALAAVAMGASVVEVHMTLSRNMFGPDIVASVTQEEFTQMVKGIRFIEAMNNNPVDKDCMASELEDVRSLFVRSAVARYDLKAGESLTSAMIAFKKPGGGVDQSGAAEFVGQKLLRDVGRDERLDASCFDLNE